MSEQDPLPAPAPPPPPVPEWRLPDAPVAPDGDVATTGLDDHRPSAVEASPDTIDVDVHARWDEIENEGRRQRGEPERALATTAPPHPPGQRPFAPPPLDPRPAGASYFAGYGPNGLLAGLTQVGLALTTLALGILLFVTWGARDVLHRLEAGDAVLSSDIADADADITRWLVITIGLLVVTGVAFIAWFRRSYTNTQALNPWQPLRRTPGWAVGAWFVPFLNLVRPVSMAHEMWRRSESIEATRATAATVLWVWWPAWILGGVGYRVTDTARALDEGSTPGALLTANSLGVFGLVSSVVAGLAAMVLVSRLTQRLDARFLELRAWEEARSPS